MLLEACQNEVRAVYDAQRPCRYGDQCQRKAYAFNHGELTSAAAGVIDSSGAETNVPAEASGEEVSWEELMALPYEDLVELAAQAST